MNTLSNYRDMIEVKTDEDFDSDEDFVNLLNVLINQINMEMSAKFTEIDISNFNLDDDFTTLTGIPTTMKILIISGMSWLIQDKEEDNNWAEHKTDFLGAVGKLKHLVPPAYQQIVKNDVYSIKPTIDLTWE